MYRFHNCFSGHSRPDLCLLVVSRQKTVYSNNFAKLQTAQKSVSVHHSFFETAGTSANEISINRFDPVYAISKSKKRTKKITKTESRSLSRDTHVAAAADESVKGKKKKKRRVEQSGHGGAFAIGSFPCLRPSTSGESKRAELLLFQPLPPSYGTHRSICREIGEIGL